MKYRTMYAVVAVESFLQDLTAMFDDETQAEEYRDKISGDPDFDGTDYAVIPVSINTNTIQEAVEKDQ